MLEDDGSLDNLWPPRRHAAVIVGLPTREARRARLLDVPEQYRNTVRIHVERYFMVRRAVGG